MKKIKNFKDYITEATNDNTDAIKFNAVVYNKYKTRVVSMFNNAKPEDIDKITESFENFINGLPENEKGSSDLLRTLFSSEKLKFDIKALQIKKTEIDEQIQQRMKDLKQISDNLR